MLLLVDTTGVTVDYGVKAGQTQTFTHPPGGPPPFNKLDAPRHDSMNGTKVKEGFEGKQKGVAQILFESGWWSDKEKTVYKMPSLHKVTGMRKDTGAAPPDKSRIGELILAARKDFTDELSQLAKIIHARGHVLIMSPRCHPELAGLGIEYCWGASKQRFRRDNDLVPANFEKNVRASLTCVTRSLAHKFERRSRTYRYVLSDPTNDSYNLIERAVKKFKSHRDAGDFDGKFIRDSLDGSEAQHSP